jgi:hypothetical protein
VTVTVAEAREQLERALAAVPSALVEAKRAAGESAAAAVAAAWPRDSGDSSAAWEGDERGVRNPLPYVQHVHDGLADRLVPEALRDAETVFATEFVRRIDAAAGW